MNEQFLDLSFFFFTIKRTILFKSSCGSQTGREGFKGDSKVVPLLTHFKSFYLKKQAV